MYENDLKVCRHCGTRAERTTQKFCENCGASLYEVQYQASGWSERETDGMTEEPVRSNKRAQGMKWYYFLVSFYMMFIAIMNVVNSFLYFSGNYVAQFDTTADAFYREYGAVMKGVDIAYGVVLVGSALFLFITRTRMVRFMKNAPALFLTYYVFNFLTEAAYYIGSVLIRDGVISYIDVSYITALIAVYTVFIILNAVYFRKRAALFVN